MKYLSLGWKFWCELMLLLLLLGQSSREGDGSRRGGEIL